jgi:Ca2+-binding EF-hand superfamily protein
MFNHNMNAFTQVSIAVVAAGVLLTFNTSAQDRGPGGPGGGRGNLMRTLPVVRVLDTNQDGTISEQEINNAPAALRTLDKNKDGRLTEEELRPDFGDRERGRAPGEGDRGPRGSAEMVNRMMAMDKNSDGKLTKDELPERMQQLLASADENKDGALTKDEIAKFAEKQMAGMNRGEGRGESREGERPTREGGERRERGERERERRDSPPGERK